MAKVRCPLCSNLNPPEAEECSFCGARLKPVLPSSKDQNEESSDENRPGDENDWLRSLQSDQDDTGESPVEQPESGAEVPDWLSRIRNRAQEETGAEEDQPDWMQDLSEDETAGSAQTEDWLDRLETPAQADQIEPSGAEAAQPAEGLPDWLKDLSGAPEAQSEEPGTTAGDFGNAEEEEDFSFLGSEPLAETPGQASVTGSGFGLTDFLSDLEEQSAAPEGEEEDSAAQAESGAGLPDWLSADTPAESESTSAEIPGWLSDLTPEEAPSETESLEEAPAALDWLPEQGEEHVEVGEPQEQEEPQAALSEKPASEELPSWLIDDEAAAAQASTVSETQGPAAEEAETPAGEELPDWITGLEAPALEQPEPPDIPAPTPLFADELPDFGSEESRPVAPEEEEPVTAMPQEEVPDWLRDFEEQSPSSASVPPLFETEGEAEKTGSAEGEQPFEVDLPEWLTEDAQPEQGQESPQAAEPVDEELAKADLPEWVKEMRPIESIIPSGTQLVEGEPQAEKSGPLAGLAGILPAEEMVSQYRRPPVYSSKLRVTEKQRGQASQFETIIEQETQPLLIPARGKRVSGGWLRVLIAMLLIFVLVLPPILDLEPLAVPALSPDETKRMFDQIEGGLTSSTPVLLAVDFDPALWGEMKLASLPVIDHIMSRNARIVVVSTRANGPALAEQLLSETVAGHDGYNLGEMTENLGYLPGDMISLLEFAQQPVFAAPANLAGELAWERPALQGISSLRDFASVVVLTDTAETGRAWVEQVQPEMGDVPLLMVTSAQAAPMMTPFVESGQVDGMVSGLLGGVLYSQWAQKEGPGFAYLATYQVGVLLALAMALGGGLISGAIALINRGKDED